MNPTINKGWVRANPSFSKLELEEEEILVPRSQALVPVKLEGGEEVLFTPGAIGGKRSRAVYEEGVPILTGRRKVKVVKRRTGRGRTRKGGPNLKQRLLRDLRAQRKRLRSELRQVERDYKSLICRRKSKKAE